MYRGNDRSVDPDRLRALAKTASDRHLGSGLPMTEAVVQTVKDEPGLGPEHVKRIVEFANNETFHRRFQKEAGDHRVINFPLANPGDVLKELNMGAAHQPTAVSDHVMAPDYVPGQDSAGDPFETSKTASAEDEPSQFGELWRMHQRLDDLHSHLSSEFSGAAIYYDEAAGQMQKVARAAVLDGASPADIVNAVSFYSDDDDMTKLALGFIADGIGDVPPGAGLRKSASAVPHPDHPLVTSYKAFAKVAMDRFRLSAALERVASDLKAINSKIAEFYR